MNPSRSLLVALAVGAAAVLTACGDETRPAAVVDGTEISQQAVVDELEAIRGNRLYLEAIEASGQPVLGEGEDAFNSAFVAVQLETRIQFAIVANEIRARGLRADAECRAAGRDSVVRRLAGASPTGDGEAVLDAFPAGYRDYLVQRETDLLILQGDLIDQPCVPDDAVGAYFEANRDDFEQACSHHILVGSLEEAEAVKAELDAGADFGAIAEQRSLDPGSASQGGDLQCVTRGQFLPEFEEALFSQPIGAIGEPVQTAAGFHVIRVDSRGVPDLDEVRDLVAQRIGDEANNALREWFANAVAAADVDLDPRYGSWDPSLAQIERPAFEASSTTASSG